MAIRWNIFWDHMRLRLSFQFFPTMINKWNFFLVIIYCGFRFVH